MLGFSAPGNDSIHRIELSVAFDYDNVEVITTCGIVLKIHAAESKKVFALSDEMCASCWR